VLETDGTGHGGVTLDPALAAAASRCPAARTRQEGAS
jgi:hypothetical protein